MAPDARCMSFVIRCILPVHGACCLGVVCCTRHVICCIFPVACCMPHVAFSPVYVACCMSSVVCMVPWCAFSSGVLRGVSCVVICGIAVRRIVPAARSPLYVVCGLWSVAFPRVPCCMACAVCRPVPRRISSRRTLCVASRLLHVVAWPLPVPSRTSSAASRVLPVAERLSAVALAAHRGGACNLGRSDH